eukprot:TRINITY_DN1357_c0_g2_i1.p1 TRINITY_DN1357_c0_g2~~TRINITY_DN1357_c0_g2_i1.p1  ORF type:complete len:969 (-),score=142.03 TRINITY_DN1357_c0_g2_i1:326-3232(-)
MSCAKGTAQKVECTAKDADVDSNECASAADESDDDIRTDLRKNVEAHFEKDASIASSSLVDILCIPSVTALLKQETDVVDKMRALKHAIEASQKLQVVGSRVVRLRTDGSSSQDPTLDLHTSGYESWWFGAEAFDPMNPQFQHMDDSQQQFYNGCFDTVRGQAWNDDRRKRAVEKIVRYLHTREFSQRTESDGSVHAHRFLSKDPWLHKVFFGKEAQLLRWVRLHGRLLLKADEEALTVRLLCHDEKICAAAEDYFFVDGPNSREVKRESAPLIEVLRYPQVWNLVISDAALSSTDGTETALASLRQALSTTELLQLSEDDSEILQLRPTLFLREVVDDFLSRDKNAARRFQTEGEINLTWLLATPPIRKALERVAIHGEEASLGALQIAMRDSKLHILDKAGLCLRQAERIASDAQCAITRTAQPCLTIPKERDAGILRNLLSHYFDNFSIQNNRYLLACVQKQSKYSMKASHQTLKRPPTFSVSDICKLPRVQNCFAKYLSDAHGLLLAGALMECDDQRETEMPVRAKLVSAYKGPRGTWASRAPDIELTYMPSLRFFEVKRPCNEVDRVLDTKTEPVGSFELDPHAFLVASYSVSSDLSHDQSPKALELHDDITLGKLDASTLAWDHRAQRIKRQLVAFNPDFVCIQGVQSLGFKNRCSEQDKDWFWSDEDAASNHLAHFYREMSKLNYGVAFSPTLRQPGSDVACFGNAIFWRRSRWSLGGVFGDHTHSAILARFESRVGGPHVVICCSKSAASYARDWGESAPCAEEARTLADVESFMAETAQRGESGVKDKTCSPARVIWCGDFACDLDMLKIGIQECYRAQKKSGDACESDDQDSDSGDPPASMEAYSSPLEWSNACAGDAGSHDPWTHVAPSNAHDATDLILHDPRLEVVATLGGFPHELSLSELLQFGNPSDHLMQLALFVNERKEDPSLAAAAAFPRMAKSGMRCPRARSYSRVKRYQ